MIMIHDHDDYDTRILQIKSSLFVFVNRIPTPARVKKAGPDPRVQGDGPRSRILCFSTL